MQSFVENYCSFCGKELGFKNLYDGTTEKYCVACDYVFFPAVTPAVIVLVTFGEQVLLSRGVGWEHPYWGFIAGHITPGESAVAAVEREVMEEVGLSISPPEFITSYPHKTDRNILMLAFCAHAKTSELKISQELTAAQWFNLHEDLPIKPGSKLGEILQQIFLKKK